MPNLHLPSLRWRLTAWYGLILLTTFGAVTILVLLTLRHSIRVTVDRDLEARLLTVRTYVEEEASGSGASHLGEELNEDAVASAGPAHLRIRGSDGEYLYRSRSTRNWPVSIPDRKELPSEGLFQSLVINGKEVRVLSAPVSVGVVQVGLPLDEFDEIQRTVVWTIFLAVPALLLVASAGGYWMSGRALRPVDEIANAARRITAGTLSERLPRSGRDDEIDRLTQVLNDMLAGLESAFKRITQFTADASHELRTPLAIIRTTAEVMGARARSAEEQERAWASVLMQTERTTQLVDDLLTLTRGDSGSAGLQFEVLDLGAITRRACSEIEVIAASKGVALQVAALHGILVNGDAEGLRRTVTILLDNALKATGAGGRIRVTVSPNQGQDQSAVVQVDDTGSGIPEQDLPHIFDRFYRVSKDRSRETGGAGLGLSIAQWIINQHGGSIDVESEVGKGSKFRVQLPIRNSVRESNQQGEKACVE